MATRKKRVTRKKRATRKKAKPKGVPAGTPPVKVKRIAISQLKIDDYQRQTINERTVRDIVADGWSDLLAGHLLVAHRGGEYYAVDGQHRQIAAGRLGRRSLLCNVFESNSPELEAWLFLQANRRRSSVNALDLFWAGITAGVTENVELLACIEKVGFTVPRTNSNHWPNICCIRAIETLATSFGKTDGHRAVRRALHAIKEAYADGKASERSFALSAKFLPGLVYALGERESIDDKRLVTKLRKQSPVEIHRRASSLKEAMRAGGGGRHKVAGAEIVSLYNTRNSHKVTPIALVVGKGNEADS